MNFDSLSRNDDKYVHLDFVAFRFHVENSMPNVLGDRAFFCIECRKYERGTYTHTLTHSQKTHYSVQ